MKATHLIAYISVFSKAFDKICHSKLLQKVQNLGKHTHKWIESFMIGRSQAVVVGQAKFPRTLVSSRIPQGSCLGSIYSLYIQMIYHLL